MPVTPFRIRPVICLFGDSITQQGFGTEGCSVGWASLLAASYTRRADVLNRGFSGYNTDHALELLPRIFGPFTSSTAATDNDVDTPTMLFCTVFFGANDAALPGEDQHVPVTQFGDNIEKIVSRIRARCCKSSNNNNESSNESESSNFPIILLTPPPVDETAWAAWREISKSDRENNVAREYGAAVKEVGARLNNCEVVDTWELLEGDSEDRGKFLSDGLHLNEKGNRLVYQGLMNVVQTKFPALAPMEDGEGKYGTSGIPVEEKLWQDLV